MKLIECATWREASQKVGAHVVYAQTIDEAIKTMKHSHPDIVPHTCYWHKVFSKTDKKHLGNQYYFVWGNGNA